MVIYREEKKVSELSIYFKSLCVKSIGVSLSTKAPQFELSQSSEPPGEMLTMPRSFKEKVDNQSTEGRGLVRLKEN